MILVVFGRNTSNILNSNGSPFVKPYISPAMSVEVIVVSSIEINYNQLKLKHE